MQTNVDRATLAAHKALIRGGLSPKLTKYPSGTCAYVCGLLGELLRELGHGSWMVTSGINETGRTHAWLEQDDVIIDITAYQFDGVDEPIIVTTDRTWHDQSWRPMGGALVASVAFYTEPRHREMALSDHAELRTRALAILAATG